MAGHTLLAVLVGFSWVMFFNGSSLMLILGCFPVLVVFLLVFLEGAVAFIQAYVFSILSCMYVNESVNLSH
jgi:F-type H+-transporting ATPase subunit a